MSKSTQTTLTTEIEAELTALCIEYDTWQREQGVALGSADEHIFDENLTDAQGAAFGHVRQCKNLEITERKRQNDSEFSSELEIIWYGRPTWSSSGS